MNNYLSESKYQEKLKRIQANNASRERKRKLKEEEKKYKLKFRLPSTSKLMAVYLFIVLNVVLCYSMAAMWYFRDLTYLGVLITDVAAQVLTYFIYAKKSAMENTKNGIIYESAMRSQMQIQNENFNNDEAVG